MNESTHHEKKFILKKTLEVSLATMLSRLLGLARVVLLAKYLGVGIISDAFLAAFRIPNSLRKIFAEGALSAAFIPTIVGVVHEEGVAQASRLMTLAFIFFEGILALLCILIFAGAPWVIKLVAPGFSPEHIAYATPYLRILVSFILFISSSALLTGALQSVNHFFIPAMGPVLLNIVFIASLITGLMYGLPVEYLCYGILCGGILLFLMHLIVYFQRGFCFASINASAWRSFRLVLTKFAPVLFSMSVMEINLVIDTIFASYLPHGSYTIVEYASRFMGIPLGVFSVAFATILLPHFSRISKQAPERLGFYLRESAKFIFFVTVPATIFMSIFAHDIFSTIFLSSKFSLEHVMVAQYVLIGFLIGLFFFSINKVLLNVYYALHANWIPTLVSIIATILNIGFNFVGAYFLGAPGLALATTCSGAIQAALFTYFLRTKFGFDLQLNQFANFALRYLGQLILITPLIMAMHTGIKYAIGLFCSSTVAQFMLTNIGFWLWTGPLCALAAILIITTKRWFGVQLHFVD